MTNTHSPNSARQVVVAEILLTLTILVSVANIGLTIYTDVREARLIQRQNTACPQVSTGWGM